MDARHLAAQGILRADHETPTAQRIQETLTDPIAFAFTYLLHHLWMPSQACSESPCLHEDHQHYTLSQMHEDWADTAKQTLLIPNHAYRASFIAPRDSGKSTWWFLIIPLWAAAHGHSKFCAAFADSGTQAEKHLSTFKHELDTNQLLQHDFPNLTKAQKRPTTGGNVADNRSLIVTAHDFSFNATGIDASTLGLKINQTRPDFLIFDDIEPDESTYSLYQAKKRLTTVQDAILPMNLKAKVFFIGTVTMAGGLTHQLQAAAQANQSPETNSDEIAQWIKDEKIQIFYYPPILQITKLTHNKETNKKEIQTTEHSIWPEKWPLEYLNSIKHTRSYAKNFRNQPKPVDSDYWNDEDFQYGVPGPPTHCIITIDPAITTKQKSDYTGIAVVSYKPQWRGSIGKSQTAWAQQSHHDNLHLARGPGQQTPIIDRTKLAITVHDAYQVKLVNELLRQQVLQTIAQHQDTNHPPRYLYIEVNQGGQLWYGVFHDMPIPVKVMTTNARKEVRAARTLNYYQRQYVWHASPIPALEEQMTAFPNGLHDDMIDAVGMGVLYYMDRLKRKAQPQIANVSYLR